jgi:ABC-type glycerol-3-phosphate transport system substrate-binding protein
MIRPLVMRLLAVIAVGMAVCSVSFAAAQAVPTPEPGAAAPLTLWVPAPLMLAQLQGETGRDVLEAQLAVFRLANPERTIVLRVKAYAGPGGGEIGGLLGTLRSAAEVAPGALPDVVLLHTADLADAAHTGLLQPIPIGGAAPVGDSFAAATALGIVDGALFGVPALIDPLYVTVRLGGPPLPPARLAELPDAQAGFAFAAGAPGGLSDVLYLQYRDASGSPAPGESGVSPWPTDALPTRPASPIALVDFRLDSDGLRALFRFYETAVEAGVFNPSPAAWAGYSDYAAALAEGELSGVVTASQYLRMTAETGERFVYGPVPTLSGQPVTVVEGWVWALVTRDAARQAEAVRLLSFLRDAERQAEFARAVGYLPAGRAALDTAYDAGYAAFTARLMERALLPPDDEGGALARAMQTAFIGVLEGTLTASDGVRAVSAAAGE